MRKPRLREVKQFAQNIQLQCLVTGSTPLGVTLAFKTLHNLNTVHICSLNSSFRFYLLLLAMDIPSLSPTLLLPPET